MSTPLPSTARPGHAIQRELDMSIGERLAIGFGLLLLVLGGFAAAVYVFHSRSADAQRTYTDRIAPISARADALERATLYVGIGMRSYLLIPDPQRLATFRRYSEQVHAALRAFETAGAASDSAMVSQIGSQTRVYVERVNQMVTARSAGPLRPQDEEQVVELRERAVTTLHRFIDIQRQKTEQALIEMAAARDRVTQALALLTIVGVVVCLLIAYVTTQSIRRPTRHLVGAADALRRGDWKPALGLAAPAGADVPERSEMRRVARAIGAAATALELRDRDLREKNERIQAQNEELQAQNEEIQSQSEELQAQSEELLSKSGELHSQNEELVQQGGELRAQGEALAEANERKNHFLGVLAHELRNPLAPISNSIFVLKRVPAGSEQALRAHAVIERQTRHMVRLVDDLLDVTRISRGKIRVEPQPLDFAALIRVSLEDQHETLKQNGYVLDVDLPAEGVPVSGDHTRLSQVVGNLLSNAMKFTEPGGRITVSLQVDPERREAVLRVADTGVGMDAALVPLLFKPFTQGAHNFKHTNAGLGLGLALVKALVDLHGGGVSAYSAGANQGSEFIVRLPLHTEAPAAS